MDCKADQGLCQATTSAGAKRAVLRVDMSTFLSFIGGGFLILAALGAIVPGMNFHVVFASDAEALKWHHRLAKELEDNIQSKESAK